MTPRRIAVTLAVTLFAASPTVHANTYTVVFDANATWSQAQTAATLAGGYLATITSAAEQAQVNSAISAAAPGQDGGYWINMVETTEGCYVWNNGESSCYMNFYQGEPNNGAPGETRGQIMWSLSDPSRRGFWNDVPAAGITGSTDISRRGYVIEFGPADPADGPCGACIRVSPNSPANNPPGGSTVTTTKVSGISTGPGIIPRTIIDAVPPPGPNRARPADAQCCISIPTVTVAVPSSGIRANTVAAAFVDSINRAVGGFGFVANFANMSDSSVFR